MLKREQHLKCRSPPSNSYSGHEHHLLEHQPPPFYFTSTTQTSKMADVDMVDAPGGAGAVAKKAKGTEVEGKGDGKKRFEVKKVRRAI